MKLLCLSLPLPRKKPSEAAGSEQGGTVHPRKSLRKRIMGQLPTIKLRRSAAGDMAPRVPASTLSATVPFSSPISRDDMPPLMSTSLGASLRAVPPQPAAGSSSNLSLRRSATQTQTLFGGDFPDVSPLAFSKPGAAGWQARAASAAASAERLQDVVAAAGQPHALKTNVEATPEAVAKVLAEFEEEKRLSGKPVAVVSGGGVAGYAAALVLIAEGFNVLLVEQRKTISRKNVFSLKEEAIYSMAHLSPDGTLLRRMFNQQLLSVCKRVVEEVPSAGNGNGDGEPELQARLEVASRLMRWLLPEGGMPVQIPRHLSKARARGAHLHLDGVGTGLPSPPLSRASTASIPAGDSTPLNFVGLPSDPPSPPLGPLDLMELDWPGDDALENVDPAQWRYGDLSAVSADNLVLAMVMDLEAGLNLHCSSLADKGLRVVNARAGLKPEQEEGDFKPVIRFPGLAEADGSEAAPSCEPDFHIDLIVGAEGANSENRELHLGGHSSVPTEERWDQRNVIGTQLGIDGFHRVHIEGEDIAVTQYIERGNHSIANISVLSKREQPDAPEVTAQKIQANQATLDAGGADIDIQKGASQFDSGAIHVKLGYAHEPAIGNVVQTGDQALSGSPVGGYGAGAALSAFPEAIRRYAAWVRRPEFTSGVPALRSAVRKRAADQYRRDVADIADFRHRRPTDIMQALGHYKPETVRALAEQAVVGRFGRKEVARAKRERAQAHARATAESAQPAEDLAVPAPPAHPPSA